MTTKPLRVLDASDAKVDGEGRVLSWGPFVQADPEHAPELELRSRSSDVEFTLRTPLAVEVENERSTDEMADLLVLLVGRVVIEGRNGSAVLRMTRSHAAELYNALKANKHRWAPTEPSECSANKKRQRVQKIDPNDWHWYEASDRRGIGGPCRVCGRLEFNKHRSME